MHKPNRPLLGLTIFIMALSMPSLVFSKVFLNGVDISDVTDKTFSKVKSVRIDAKGDIYLDAPQYEVKVLETGGDKPAADKSEKPVAADQLQDVYYIASQGKPDKVQYGISVSINGVLRLEIDVDEFPVITDITPWLKKGENTIRITAKKQLGTVGRISTSTDDELSLLIGAGHEEKKVVHIDALKATFTCNASTTNSLTREYKLFAQ